MKKLIIITLAILIMATPVYAGEGWIKDTGWWSWDKRNTELHVPLMLSLLADYKTTGWHIKNGKQPGYTYTESNYFLGKNPSLEENREYFAWVVIGSTAITFVLPPIPSYTFQGGVISLELYVIAGNISAGAKIEF